MLMTETSNEQMSCLLNVNYPCATTTGTY